MKLMGYVIVNVWSKFCFATLHTFTTLSLRQTNSAFAAIYQNFKWIFKLWHVCPSYNFTNQKWLLLYIQNFSFRKVNLITIDRMHCIVTYYVDGSWKSSLLLPSFYLLCGTFFKLKEGIVKPTNTVYSSVYFI